MEGAAPKWTKCTQLGCAKVMRFTMIMVVVLFMEMRMMMDMMMAMVVKVMNVVM